MPKCLPCLKGQATCVACCESCGGPGVVRVTTFDDMVAGISQLPGMDRLIYLCDSGVVVCPDVYQKLGINNMGQCTSHRRQAERCPLHLHRPGRDPVPHTGR